MSKGETGSDSSSKDGSIQSDTSIDSEDSCVSVIFVPHPETKFNKGDEGGTMNELGGKKQRSTSNSSESSDSVHSGSGRGSPMSPGILISTILFYLLLIFTTGGIHLSFLI